MRRYRRRAEGRLLRVRLVLAALLFVLLAAWVDSRLEPVVQDLTANEAKARAVQLVSEAVEKSLAGQEEPVSAMVSIQYAESGEIASLTTDMAQLNVLKSRLLAGVQQELGESVHIDLGVPVGTLLGGGLLHGDHHRLRLGGLRRRQERRGQKHCQQQRCDPHENGLLHVLSPFAPAYAAAGGGMTGRFCSLTLFRDGIIIVKITFCIFCRADVRALMGAN